MEAIAAAIALTSVVWALLYWKYMFKRQELNRIDFANGSQLRFKRKTPLPDYSFRSIDDMFHKRWFIEQYNSPYLDEEQKEKLMDYYHILYGDEREKHLDSIEKAFTLEYEEPVPDVFEQFLKGLEENKGE